MNLSEHFTLQEFTKSETAAKFGIENIPTEEHTENMTYLCVNLLEKIRTILGQAVIVTSGYRSSLLNVTMRKAGYHTSKTSQHMKGEAADIIIHGVKPSEIAKLILKNGIVFDQCIIESALRIDENGKEHESNWLHISIKKNGKNRMQVLVMHNGKVI